MQSILSLQLALLCWARGGGHFIQLSVVNTHALCTIFLCYQHNGHLPWALRGSDDTLIKMGSYFSSQHILRLVRKSVRGQPNWDSIT